MKPYIPKGNTLDSKFIEQRIFFPRNAKVAFGGPSYEWNEHMKNVEYPKQWIVVNDEEKMILKCKITSLTNFPMTTCVECMTIMKCLVCKITTSIHYLFWVFIRPQSPISIEINMVLNG
jgi:hypothetical protein